MDEDELDKLATDAKLEQIGAGDKTAYLEDLFSGMDRSGSYDKGTGLNATGAANQLSRQGASNLDRVLEAFSRSSVGGAPLRAARPTGQLGQLGQLQMQMSGLGGPSQLGPQLCTPRPLMALSGAGRSSRNRNRAAKKKRGCSCNH